MSSTPSVAPIGAAPQPTDSVLFLAGELIRVNEFTTQEGERRYEHHISRPARNAQSSPMKFSFTSGRKVGSVGADIRVKCEAMSYRRSGISEKTGKKFELYNVRFVEIEA